MKKILFLFMVAIFATSCAFTRSYTVNSSTITPAGDTLKIVTLTNESYDASKK